MYLHVGNNQNIRIREIIGIFDADTATVSAVTKKYISAANAKKIIQFASEELPKSFVVCAAPEGQRVYLSQLNSSTLLRRSEQRGIE